jgi:hypothetical protein
MVRELSNPSPDILPVVFRAATLKPTNMMQNNTVRTGEAAVHEFPVNPLSSEAMFSVNPRTRVDQHFEIRQILPHDRSWRSRLASVA